MRQGQAARGDPCGGLAAKVLQVKVNSREANDRIIEGFDLDAPLRLGCVGGGGDESPESPSH